MAIFTKNQQEIATSIESESKLSHWLDWKWQVKHAIKSIEQFELLTGIQFSDKERKALQKTIDHFPLSITPYYLSLIDKNNYQNDPIFKQAFADIRELHISKDEMKDPLAEDHDSPVPGITHRYPDRVLFLISNVCAMYCRHCTRKRKVGYRQYTLKITNTTRSRLH